MSESLNGKRLLVLGGTKATYDLVKMAKEMGVYTIVTDDCANSITKTIADESAMVSTIDIEGLTELIKEKNIDGVFCGPSEFNIRNLIKVCKAANKPCYTDMETWDKCANKDVFKNYCREYGVDCTPEYDITEASSDEEIEKIDYPVIIKPVDGSSSAGITVCRSKEDVRPALKAALDVSKSKKIICEKYIENGGELFSVRYMIKDGEAYPYFLMDTYIASPEKRWLVSFFTYAPSKYFDYYMENMDAKVRKMLKGMGLKNGTAFIQSLPCDGKIYFHEMGYRLSGGMIFKLTVPTVGVNDMKMMIRYSLGEEIFSDEEISKIDLKCSKNRAGQLMIPLNVGKISKIEGLEEVKKIPCFADFIQLHEIGDIIEKKNIGTLAQHFGRLTFISDNPEEIKEAVEKVNETLFVYDENGNVMNELKFDLNRMEK